MKKTAITYLLLSFLISISCFAQDTLVKKNGQQIIGKVLEVSSTEVKYKKADFPDGPTYTELKSTLERIKYNGGHVDIFQEVKVSKVEPVKTEDDYRQPVNDYKQPINKSQIVRKGSYYVQDDNFMREGQMYKELLKVKDPEITYRVKRARSEKGLRYMGFAAIPVFLGTVIIASISASSSTQSPTSREPLNIFLAGAAASGILLGTSIYFNIDRKVQNARAVRLYNEKYAK